MASKQYTLKPNPEDGGSLAPSEPRSLNSSALAYLLHSAASFLQETPGSFSEMIWSSPHSPIRKMKLPRIFEMKARKLFLQHYISKTRSMW